MFSGRKGYTGANVKMAIFNTGIRADHPHFRNIKVPLFRETRFPAGSSESGATQNLLQTGSSKEDPAVLGLLEIGDIHPVATDENQLPSRRSDVNFSTYSSVIGKELICQSDSRFEWRIARWRSAKDEDELSSSRSIWEAFSIRDEIDMSFLAATRWIVPAGVAASDNIASFFQYLSKSYSAAKHMGESGKRGVGGEGHLGLIDQPNL
ncbi:hypothetical protein YC2023_123376 [Brassica napus]